MKIVLDRSACDGIGMCEAMAPDYFELDDEDQLTILNDTPPEADLARVRAAVESCPNLALRLEE